MSYFEGIVRNESGGRRTLYLEYEAYEAMALQQMGVIAAAMRGQFGADCVALVHRLGRLEIGETSVLIAVSSAHRRAAFEACRYGIDTLKRTVPIWKKGVLRGRRSLGPRRSSALAIQFASNGIYEVRRPSGRHSCCVSCESSS